MCLQGDGYTNEFGTQDLTREWYGGTVGIRTPPEGFFQANDEFVLHRTVVQSSYRSSEPGLIQAGVYRSGNALRIDNCVTTDGAYQRFAEWKDQRDPTYNCRVFTELGALAPNSEANYAVHYLYGSGDSTRPYRWGIDTTTQSSGSMLIDLNFHTGFPAIGGEIADADGDAFATTTASVYGATRRWRYYRHAGDTSPAAVTASDAKDRYTPTTARWDVPTYVGDPISIRHNPPR